MVVMMMWALVLDDWVERGAFLVTRGKNVATIVLIMAMAEKMDKEVAFLVTRDKKVATMVALMMAMVALMMARMLGK